MEEIERAKKIFLETKNIRFDNEPDVDASDRLGLLTVVAGLREVAAFGFAERENEGQIRSLKDRLGNYGLLCQVTRQVCPLSHQQCGVLPSELVAVFDKVNEESNARNSARLLWVYRHREIKEQVTKAVNNEIESGAILGYPNCCVEQDRARRIRSGREFSLAVLDAVGKDPKAVERALREDMKVPLRADLLQNSDLAKSKEQFPFVQHIACATCLTSESSPSESLNRTYGELARTISPTLHRVVHELSAIESKFVTIVDAANVSGLVTDTLKRETREQIQRLSHERDRIYAELDLTM